MNMTTVPCIRRLPIGGLALAFVAALMVPTASAKSATATGPAALALAAVVASHSTALSAAEKGAMARLLAGNGNVNFAANKKISVTANSVQCKVSNVDIVSRSCELTFGSGKRSVTGRDANEIYGSLAVAGVMEDGAAGTLSESVTKLMCTIDPGAIKQKGGGGADCAFTTGE